MFKVLRLVIITTAIMHFSSCSVEKEELGQPYTINVVPRPHKVLMRGGVLSLNKDFWVIANVGDQTTSDLAETLVKGLEELTSKNIGISDLYSTRKHDQRIQLEIKNNYNSASDQAYTLDITSNHINITAGTSLGVYYGIQSMLQILRSSESEDGFIIPKMIIKDLPKYKIRGVILNHADFSSEDIQSMVRTMTKYKLNSIYMLGNDITIEPIKKYFEGKPIEVNAVTTPPDDLTIIALGDTREELLIAFDVNKNPVATEGYLLDLTSSTLGNTTLKLRILSEISWSENKNRDFTSIIE